MRHIRKSINIDRRRRDRDQPFDGSPSQPSQLDNLASTRSEIVGTKLIRTTTRKLITLRRTMTLQGNKNRIHTDPPSSLINPQMDGEIY